MGVSFEKIAIGSSHTRPELARLWGYAGYEAIARGAVTPAGSRYIILFITAQKQPFLPQYRDELRDDTLVIEGETNHAADLRLVHAESGGDEIHLFFRELHHTPFVYKGQIFLVDYELNKKGPSHFEFALDSDVAAALGGLATEARTHGTSPDVFIPDEEGHRSIKEYVTYERSVKNRAQALKIHGTTCLACGFSFNAAYGIDHAGNYIEVHHVRSITGGRARPNPATDLIPLCANCHSMAHRRRGMCLDLEALKNLVTGQSNQ
jgi:5-methylcytosine-specific restriction enzyme A